MIPKWLENLIGALLCLFGMGLILFAFVAG